MQSIYGAREQAASRAALHWERARVAAPDVGLWLLLIGAAFFAALVGQ